jgi:beta-glucosidase
MAQATCWNIRSMGLFTLLVGLFFNVNSANYTDTTAPIDDRVADLVSKLSTMEKLQLRNRTSVAIPRLSIRAFQWWDEMQNGWNTVWPAAIAKACTWDRDLCYQMGVIQGDEARLGDLLGKNFYSPPVMNIAMDPRWGRNDEGWGEDPYLAGDLAVQLVHGIQGNREYRMPGKTEYYLKASCMMKHLVANNHENDRMNDCAVLDERDFYEYFLAPFKILCDNDVGASMTGLNKLTVTGNPLIQNVYNFNCAYLLDTILRVRWGFKGYQSTDCAKNEFPIAQLEAGIDGICGDGSENAFDTNTVNKFKLDRALKRLFRVRFRLGEFDPMCPYRFIPSSKGHSVTGQTLALRAAHETVVLMKNANNMLPLSKSAIKKIVVVGAMANRPTGFSDWSIFGGYSRTGSNGATTNVLDAVTKLASTNGMTLTYAVGNAGACINATSFSFTASEIAAITAADVVIGVVGTDNKNGGFQNVPCQGDIRYPGEGKDLPDLKLPGVQEAMLSAVYAYNHKLITVLQDEEVRTLPFVFDTCPAVVTALTGGQSVGQGIVDVLFGDYNPSGKLAQTWIKNIADYPGVKTAGVPDNKNYKIRDGQRTYMYYQGAVNFPFGFGLSYTTFAYSNITANVKTITHPWDTIAVISFTLQNSGSRDGAEIAQLYVHALNTAPVRPIKELRNFARVDLMHGASSGVTLGLTPRDFAYWSVAQQAFVADAGKYEILIGSSSQDIRLRDTITISTKVIIPTTPHPEYTDPVSVKQGQHLEMQAQSVTLRAGAMQRMFIDSRSVRFSGNAHGDYTIYTCNGKKMAQQKGSGVCAYLSHVPKGIYFIVDKTR